jgi:hypothetical protein
MVVENRIAEARRWTRPHYHGLPRHLAPANGLEHRLFSLVTQNWRGRPHVSYPVIVQLIAAMTVRCELDPDSYEAGIEVADADLAAVNLTRHDFHGERNYAITPNVLLLEG